MLSEADRITPALLHLLCERQSDRRRELQASNELKRNSQRDDRVRCNATRDPAPCAVDPRYIVARYDVVELFLVDSESVRGSRDIVDGQ
jgi:hypothetical protein